MTRVKKRISRSEHKSKGVVKEEPASDGDTATPVVSTAMNSEEQNHLNDDPEVEEYGETSCATPMTEKTDEDYLDVLGNGLLLKKVLDKGIGPETRPGHGDLVEISFKGWLEDGSLVENESSLTLTLGDGDVVQALELALPLADLQERFELVSDPRFAYGSRGREPDVPGDSKLRFEVAVLSARDPPCYETMSAAERVRTADQKRERGNYYYKREEYAFAVNSYTKGLKILSTHYEYPQTDAQTSDTVVSSEVEESLSLKLQNNLAATQLKIQAYDAAIKSCDAVLQKDPQNFKALFRKGKALVEQGDADEAIPILKSVYHLMPRSSMVRCELQRARAMQQRKQERWSRAASRMFPPTHRGDPQRKARFAWLRSILFSWRFLFLGSLFVAMLAVCYAWYSELLPNPKDIKYLFKQ